MKYGDAGGVYFLPSTFLTIYFSIRIILFITVTGQKLRVYSIYLSFIVGIQCYFMTYKPYFFILPLKTGGTYM